MPTYIEASQKSTTRAIWDKFFLRYWATFPWRLPLGQDPDPDNPTNYAAKPVDEAEEDAKSKLIEKMEDKIKGWLGRRKGEKLADYQYYMQHPDYKDQISAIFEERKIAHEMFAAEPEEVRQRMAKGATAKHAALLAKHENALEGLPALDEAGAEEAHLRFANVVGPLLDGLAAHTGYEISILVGRVKKEDRKVDIESVSVHVGVTVATAPNLDFSRANPNVYANVMRSFSKFEWDAHEFCEGRVKAT
ncbi:hypothetical protein B0H14DRAFT_3514773 [Mycena olivaceomarginata]|nr:hypothetical protein B0H14DRAFT_3514773 [Mycena olivaceomarginata]